MGGFSPWHWLVVLVVLVVLVGVPVLVITLVVKASKSGRPPVPARTAAPGWHPDPSNPLGLRWFDGTAWTEHARPHDAS